MKYSDLLGVKYTPHGRSIEEGFDCYGLVIEVLKRNNIFLPDLYYASEKEYLKLSKELKENGVKINKPELNCIVELEVLGVPKHIAVYIGEGYIIHTTKVVVIEQLNHYNKKIKGFWKVCNKRI